MITASRDHFNLARVKEYNLQSKLYSKILLIDYVNGQNSEILSKNLIPTIT